jgi:hypothetical protein
MLHINIKHLALSCLTSLKRTIAIVQSSVVICLAWITAHHDSDAVCEQKSKHSKVSL